MHDHIAQWETISASWSMISFANSSVMLMFAATMYILRLALSQGGFVNILTDLSVGMLMCT